MPTNVNVLQLAFAYAAILRMIGSDTVVAPRELAYLRDRFPDELLRTCGFLDETGQLTPAYGQALERAREELPVRLTEGQKLALMESLVEAAASDGVLAAEEADRLFAEARGLGLTDHAWRAHVDALIAAGRLHRDDAGS